MTKDLRLPRRPIQVDFLAIPGMVDGVDVGPPVSQSGQGQGFGDGVAKVGLGLS